GYRDIEGNFKVGAVTSILKAANDNLNEPYFICLDEMNLARVEYYFSTILSIIETKELIDGEIRSNKIFTKESFGSDEESYEVYKNVYISENIFIVGTVNMDETTFPFSKKVLDRANTIEFNEIDLDFDFLFDKEEIQGRVYDNTLLKSNYLKITDCIEDKEIALKVIENLKRCNEILIKGNYHFAYRTRDEIIFYVINAVKYNLMDFSKAMDYAIVQKILPKIGGSNESVIEILVEFFNELNGTSYKGDDIAFGTVELSQLEQSIKNYKLSSEKLIYMIRRYLRDGFTGFWK
ncbi:MAG: MrcB family domain-containing protein, partial [Sarcina sp.]